MEKGFGLIVNVYDMVGDDGGWIEIMGGVEDRKVEGVEELRDMGEGDGVVVILKYGVGEGGEVEDGGVGSGDVERGVEGVMGVVGIRGDIDEVRWGEVVWWGKLGMRIKG